MGLSNTDLNIQRSVFLNWRLLLLYLCDMMTVCSWISVADNASEHQIKLMRLCIHPHRRPRLITLGLKGGKNQCFILFNMRPTAESYTAEKYTLSSLPTYHPNNPNKKDHLCLSSSFLRSLQPREEQRWF